MIEEDYKHWEETLRGAQKPPAAVAGPEPHCICKTVSAGPEYSLEYADDCPRHSKAAAHPTPAPAASPDDALRSFRIRAASLLCETRGHSGYRPCDFCLNVSLFEPTHGQIDPTAASSPERQRVQSWANNCADYETQAREAGNYKAAEYHRGAKEAFQRVVNGARALAEGQSSSTSDAILPFGDGMTRKKFSALTLREQADWYAEHNWIVKEWRKAGQVQRGQSSSTPTLTQMLDFLDDSTPEDADTDHWAAKAYQAVANKFLNSNLIAGQAQRGDEQGERIKRELMPIVNMLRAHHYTKHGEAVTELHPGLICEQLEKAIDALAQRGDEQGERERKEYKHWGWCNGDRRVPAGEPGHSCCCFNRPSVRKGLTGPAIDSLPDKWRQESDQGGFIVTALLHCADELERALAEGQSSSTPEHRKGYVNLQEMKGFGSSE